MNSLEIKNVLSTIRWAEKRCRLCGLEKRDGLLVCWECWRKIKYSSHNMEDILKIKK